MKKHEAWCPIYGISFLFLSYDSKEAQKAGRVLDKFFGDKDNLIDSPGLCFSDSSKSLIAVTILKSSTKQMVRWMAHECLHAQLHVSNWRGVAFITEAGKHEHQCYYMQWLMGECLEVL